MLKKNANLFGFARDSQFFTQSTSRSPINKSRFTTNHNEPKPLTPNKNIKEFNITERFESNRTIITQRFDRINQRTDQLLDKQRMNKLNHTVDLSLYNAVKRDNLRQKEVEKGKERQRERQRENIRDRQRERQKESAQYKPKLGSFQASRQQIRSCVQALSIRIASQLKHIQTSITQLTVSMESIFYKKLNELKQQMTEVIQFIFTQARNNLSATIISNNDMLLKKSLEYRFSLSEHDKKLKEFKIKMENNWKKVAGEMFVDSYDEKVDNMISESCDYRNRIFAKGSSNVNVSEGESWQGLKKVISNLIKKRCT